MHHRKKCTDLYSVLSLVMTFLGSHPSVGEALLADDEHRQRWNDGPWKNT
jgi:hypothetical protein